MTKNIGFHLILIKKKKKKKVSFMDYGSVPGWTAICATAITAHHIWHVLHMTRGYQRLDEICPLHCSLLTILEIEKDI